MSSKNPQPKSAAPGTPQSVTKSELEWRVAAGDALAPAAIASVSAVAVSLVLGLLFGAPILAQDMGNRVVVLIPLRLFEFFLQTFGHQAKHLFFAVLVLVQAVLLTAILVEYWAVRGKIIEKLEPAMGPATTSGRNKRSRTKRTRAMASKPSVRTTRTRTMPSRPSGQTERTRAIASRVIPRAGIGDALALLALLWLVASVVLAPLLAPVGSATDFLAAWQLSIVATGIPGIVTAGMFVWLMRREAQTRARQRDDQARMSRRVALRQAGLALAAATVGAAAWGVLSSLAAQLGLGGGTNGGAALHLGNQPTRIVPPPTPHYGTWTPVAGQTAEVTPPGYFYYVSKNLVSDPAIDSGSWQLRVSGLVARPLTLRYADLLAMPAVQQYQTLECISNDVGGNLMSNGQWTGASLASLLGMAGVQQEATQVVFTCQDGYSDVLHLPQALGPHALVAYQLDGAPLAPLHGFPARLLVPGLYGMKNGKWLTGLQLTDTPYEGYWEQQGWSHEAVVKTTSRIDVPQDGALLRAGQRVIAGVAFSGDRGIGRVDVSVDAGQTWQTTVLKRPLAQQTWVLWETSWQALPGTYVLVVRAIDADGTVQSAVVAPTLPDGASGYDAVTVTVQ